MFLVELFVYSIIVIRKIWKLAWHSKIEIMTCSCRSCRFSCRSCGLNDSLKDGLCFAHANQSVANSGRKEPGRHPDHPRQVVGKNASQDRDQEVFGAQHLLDGDQEGLEVNRVFVAPQVVDLRLDLQGQVLVDRQRVRHVPDLKKILI